MLSYHPNASKCRNHQQCSLASRKRSEKEEFESINIEVPKERYPLPSDKEFFGPTSGGQKVAPSSAVGRINKRMDKSLSLVTPMSSNSPKDVMLTGANSPIMKKITTPASRSSIRRKADNVEGSHRAISRAVSFSAEESQLDSPLKLADKIEDLKLVDV